MSLKAVLTDRSCSIIHAVRVPSTLLESFWCHCTSHSFSNLMTWICMKLDSLNKTWSSWSFFFTSRLILRRKWSRNEILRFIDDAPHFYREENTECLIVSLIEHLFTWHLSFCFFSSLYCASCLFRTGRFFIISTSSPDDFARLSSPSAVLPPEGLWLFSLSLLIGKLMLSRYLREVQGYCVTVQVRWQAP